mmetsp:Transcript_17278/g.56516  ORF Transcript_17278/g.56516 Transcript_17278/m.56516 type:complete len:84 (-) Transcript_17278:1119-1370(-)|eukprot:scaffold13266_cov147-Isochrysis_galbana.AAC.3
MRCSRILSATATASIVASAKRYTPLQLQTAGACSARSQGLLPGWLQLRHAQSVARFRDKPGLGVETDRETSRGWVPLIPETSP